MCLITNQLAPKKAEKPIKCYKIVIMDVNSFDHKYRTAYQGYILENDIVEGKKIMSDNKEAEEDPECTGRKSIGKGFIHTFAHSSDALSLSIMMYNAIIYECEIPQGSMYYIGFMNNGLKPISYASKDLKFVRKYKFKICR